MLFGERVKEARKLSKMTQADLAEKIGVTRQTIGLIEAGKYNPSLKLCIDLAIALDKTLDDLFWIGEDMSSLMQYEYVFITDIGSTTTKGLLIGQEDGEFKLLDYYNVPTTVEKPFEDVRIGVYNAARAIQERTGIKILSESEKFRVPYLTTSSAGGGLQIMVFGLSMTDTGKAAEITAQGAGGVILRTFTIDDRVPAIEKMRLIRELHPDLVLMAGGMDGGNISAVVRLAEILSLAHPTPKFHLSGKIPLVYCGNKNARDYVSNVLQNNFETSMVENIRPDTDTWNIVPARRAIHDLFMDNVMERAPGYSEVKKSVIKNILPTPAGVERILTNYYQKNQKNIVMVDIGGATTDIFSSIYGHFSRTVAANTGMSYSISNILAESGALEIKKHIGDIYNENQIRNYISNKMLNPTYVPQYDSEYIIETSCAICGIKFAWENHKEMNFAQAQIGFLDKMRKRVDVDPFQEVFYGEKPDDLFQISDIDILIGAGGVISNTQTHEDALRILVDSFLPAGITKIALDKTFKSPHMGVLSQLDKHTALELFENECLIDIAYVIAPTGKMSHKDTIVSIREKNSDIAYAVKGGEVVYLKNGGEYLLTSNRKNYLYKNMNEFEINTELPILIDCRGREEFYNGVPLVDTQIPEFQNIEIEFNTDILKEHKTEMKHDNYRIKRELPYEGKIFVSNEQRVEESDYIGENTFTPPKIFIIDIHSFVGYNNNITRGEILDGIIVNVGDKVDIGSKIFLEDKGILGTVTHRSPVRGEIIKIEKNGMIILREIQDYEDKPHTVHISRMAKIEPKYIRNFLRFEEGDFVNKGQLLLKKQTQGLPLTAPTTGIVKKIDNEKGTVTIQYDINPIQLQAFVQGKVENVVKKHSAEIVGVGSLITGLIGFGGDNFGELKLHSNSEITNEHKDCVVFFEHAITKKNLEDAVKYNVKGIIAPSINNADWVEFYGKEIGVALTGDEKIPFTVILTQGFGDIAMCSEIKEFITSKIGRHASLSGRTQIRAGVTRPMIIIQD